MTRHADAVAMDLHTGVAADVTGGEAELVGPVDVRFPGEELTVVRNSGCVTEAVSTV